MKSYTIHFECDNRDCGERVDLGVPPGADHRDPKGWMAIIEPTSHVTKRDLWCCSARCARVVLGEAGKRSRGQLLGDPRGPFKFDNEGLGTLVDLDAEP